METLKGKSLGISISEPEDLAELGLSELHLRDAMSEVARHLLAADARLVYGGDLRSGGFTELLFEIVETHYRGSFSADPPAINFLAWPVHIQLTLAQLDEFSDAIKNIGKLVLLDIAGKTIEPDQRRREKSYPPSELEWIHGLSAMRRRMNSECSATFSMGGRRTKFKGAMPGVVEEILLSISSRKPTYLAGGFGGCVQDISDRLRWIQDTPGVIEWGNNKVLVDFSAERLENGLTHEENSRLFDSVHVDEIVSLLLRGLNRRFTKGDIK